VGIGDAENDHSFLDRCECAVAIRQPALLTNPRATHRPPSHRSTTQ
jgi:hypothetical protein